ncbi:MAG: hypothetical protein JWQ25_1468 [Daejeonella sp.]|nr:hypothetical protein [Daejeonella sp.]
MGKSIVAYVIKRRLKDAHDSDKENLINEKEIE